MSFFAVAGVAAAAILTPSEDRLDDPAERALHFLRAVLCRRRRQHETSSKWRAVVRHGFWGYLLGQVGTTANHNERRGETMKPNWRRV